MTETNLKKAIQLGKSGDKLEASQLLIDVIKQEPQNEIAWLWLATCVDTKDKKLYCVKKVLGINPENQNALSALEQLERETLDQPDFEEIVRTTLPDKNHLLGPERVNAEVDKPVKFIPAICPNCGGELRIPHNSTVVKCMYCGYDIIIHDQNVIRVEPKIEVQKVIDLAIVSERGKNYSEAYRLYSQVLEYDNENIQAWIGKGINAGFQSTLESPRFDEVISCITQAMSLGISDTKIEKNTAIVISRMANSYLNKLAFQIYNEKKQSIEIQRNSLSGVLPFYNYMAFDRIKEEYSNLFMQTYAPNIYRLIMISWKLQKDVEIATEVYKFENTIKTVSFLTKRALCVIDNWLVEIKGEINEKFPDWKPPKRKRKGIFG